MYLSLTFVLYRHYRFITSTSYYPPPADKGKFTLEGADHPGIVHKITSALASHGLSIDTMHTDQEIAPHGGAVLFKMHGIVTAGAPLAALSQGSYKAMPGGMLGQPTSVPQFGYANGLGSEAA